MPNILVGLLTFYAVFSGFVFVFFLLVYTDPIQRVWRTNKKLLWSAKILLISIFWAPILLGALLIVAVGVIRKEME